MRIIIIVWGKVDEDAIVDMEDDGDEEEEEDNNNMGGPVVGRTWSICFMFPIGSGSRPSIAHAVNSDDAIRVPQALRGGGALGDERKGNDGRRMKGRGKEMMLKMVKMEWR